MRTTTTVAIKLPMSLRNSLRLIFAAIACSAVSPLFAQPVTVPDGLNLGDTYRLIFITARESERDALSSNIADYNAFVAAEANAVPELQALGTTWTAIGSTSAIDARDNTGTNPLVELGYPIYGLSGQLEATDNADLWDPTDSKIIARDPTGESNFGYVWTGTQADGTADPINYLGAARVNYGFVNNSPPGVWLVEGDSAASGIESMYGISGLLTVVPEPSSLFLANLSLVVAFSRRRSR